MEPQLDSHAPTGEGDFDNPEREYDESSVDGARAFTRPTEACQSVGMESWGYRAGEDYYTNAHLVRAMDKILAKGNNYLLNLGPRADCTFPDEAVTVLRAVGDWYISVREAFEGTEPAPQLTNDRDVLLTRRGDTLYVHLNRVPVGAAVHLPPLTTLPASAALLNTGCEVQASVDLVRTRHDTGPCLRLRDLPLDAMAGTVPVIKLQYCAPIC